LPPKVLFADRDSKVLEAVSRGLGKHRESFAVVTASDGYEAMEVLKQNSVALAVVDHEILASDSLSLAEYISINYPHISLILSSEDGPAATAFEDERANFCKAFLRKPLDADRLCEQILATLTKEADGGVLHGVSPFIFPQLIEMENKTCTVKVSEIGSDKNGILFFSDGVLMDALCDDLHGEYAACTIFSWDKVDIAIINSCPCEERQVQASMSALLLEAMRLRDESNVAGETATNRATVADSPDPAPISLADLPDEVSLEHISSEEEAGAADTKNSQDWLIQQIGKHKGVRTIQQDPSWIYLTKLGDDLGSTLGIGRLKVCLFADNQPGNDLILLPGSEPVAVTVDSWVAKDDLVDQILVSLEEE